MHYAQLLSIFSKPNMTHFGLIRTENSLNVDILFFNRGISLRMNRLFFHMLFEEFKSKPI